MAAGKALLGRDPPIHGETVHESERTRVTRLFLAGRTVVCKEPLGPDADCRVRHEESILQRLRGVAGVPQLLDAPRYPGAIVAEDVHGECLATWVKPLAVADLIGLAAALARVVAGIHRRGLM